MNCDAHEFVTFSTCLGTREVMVQCVTCGAFGVIENPTSQEWAAAWQYVKVDGGWVTIKQSNTTPYVERNR